MRKKRLGLAAIVVGALLLTFQNCARFEPLTGARSSNSQSSFIGYPYVPPPVVNTPAGGSTGGGSTPTGGGTSGGAPAGGGGGGSSTGGAGGGSPAAGGGASSGGQTAGGGGPSTAPMSYGSGYFEMITDPLVKTGFQETDGCPNLTDNVGSGSCATFTQRNVANPLYPASFTNAPLWTIQQWGSRLNLPGGSGVPYGDGVKWDDTSKYLAFFPEGIIEMGVNGLVDWQGQYTQQQPSRPAWPSFTLGFGITSAGDTAHSPPGNLTLYKNLLVQMDVRLATLVPNRTAAYDAAKNPTSFGGFVTIQNLTAGSAGYGQYIWFSIPIYTTLQAVQPPTNFNDTYGNGLGTGMMIYSPGSQAFTSTPVSANWTHLGADILPYVKNAMNTGLQKGSLTDGDWSHYYLSGFILTWETLGLDQAAMQIKNLSIVVVR